MACASCKKISHWIVSALVVLPLLLLTVSPADAAPSNLSQEKIKSTVRESLKALLTGEDFSPALKRNQKRLNNMLAINAFNKVRLKAIMTQEVLSALEQYATSRYILQSVPERVNTWLSPHLEWKTFRRLIWQACSSVIEDGDQMKLTIGTLAPPGTPWLNIPMARLVPDLKKLSDNKVVVKIYGAGIEGEDNEVLKKMDTGQLDGCGCTALGVLEASPEASVFLIPNLFRNYDEVDYIFKKFRKRIDRSFEERGYLLAALIDTGWFYLFSKNRIASLDDFRQQKVSSWFGSVEKALYEEIGVDALSVNVNEVIDVLSSGKANTNLAPPAWMLGMQAYQYANYYIKTPWIYSPAAIIVSMKTKARLKRRFEVSTRFANNIQEMLVFEVSRLEEAWRRSARAYEERSLAAFEKKCGIKPVQLPPEDKRAIKKAAVRVRKELAGKAYSRQFMNDIVQALEEYRAGNE